MKLTYKRNPWSHIKRYEGRKNNFKVSINHDLREDTWYYTLNHIKEDIRYNSFWNEDSPKEFDTQDECVIAAEKKIVELIEEIKK